MPMLCRKCGAELEQNTYPGRPLTYCSVGCRRAAEYEARRINKAIESVEHTIRWRTISPQGTGNAQIIAAHQAELWRLEARLREILNDEALRP